ncbi:MAG: biotin/lipoyl-containing protein [Bacteroidales bacterium]
MKEFKYTINGNEYQVAISDIEDNIAKVEVNGTKYNVHVEAKAKKTFKPIIRPAAAPTTSTGAPVIERQVTKAGAHALRSPLPGVILDVVVKQGDSVKKGQKLMVLEAMKMENNINADHDGVISEIKVNKGDSVLEGAELVIIG